MSILSQLQAEAYRRVSSAKQRISAERMQSMAEQAPAGHFEFERAIGRSGLSFICECKKASPSKGLIDPEYDYIKIAEEYQAAGADCISVLTEPRWFEGDDEHIRRIAERVKLPCLRKDFTVDEYMIYQAKMLGASAVLLICSLSDTDRLKKYIAICDKLGLSALTEAHDEQEIKSALKAGARIIGVNNRNLGDFSVDKSNSLRLRQLVPADVLFVAESGMNSPQDIKNMQDAGVDAVLVGEALMRAADKSKTLKYLKSEIL